MIDLRLGDCLEVLKEIPDNSVDLVLCDLPYGTTACKWDTVIPLEPLWAHYKRVTKPNAAIVLTASQPFTTTLIQSNIKDFRYEWIWDKINGKGHMNCKKMPMRAHEQVLVFSVEPANYYPIMRDGEMVRASAGNPQKGEVYGHNGFVRDVYETDKRFPVDVLRFKSDDHRVRVHPTQKPVALMEYLIRTYTNEGETVLDNCMGSGTTGVACVNTGRNFIGIEREPEYFEIAKARIESAQNELKQLEIAI